MKGFANIFYIYLVFFIVILTAAAMGITLLLSSDISEDRTNTTIYTMNNALDGAENYMDTAFAFSLYQACYDGLASLDYNAYTATDFLYELETNTRKNLNEYTRGKYNFRELFEVDIPEYDLVTITPYPLPGSTVPNEYQVQLGFYMPESLEFEEHEYSKDQVQSIMDQVEAGSYDSMAELAIYKVFRSDGTFLERTNTFTITPDLQYYSLDETQKSRRMIASGIVAEALAKFKPEFINQHVKKIIVLGRMKILIFGNYVLDGTQYIQASVGSIDSFSTTDGDILIDYDLLVEEGPNAVYREIANILAFKDLDPQEWIADTGIDKFISGEYRRLNFMKQTGSGIWDYYVSESGYTSSNPLTLPSKKALNGPRFDFAETARIIMSGGQEYEDLLDKAYQENRYGGYFLNKKIQKAISILNGNEIEVQIMQAIRTIINLYTMGPFHDLLALETNELEIINNALPGTADTYSRILVKAYSRDNFSVNQAGDRINITLTRSSSRSIERQLDCFKVFLHGEAMFDPLYETINETLSNTLNGLPDNLQAEFPEEVSDQEACEYIFVQDRGKIFEAYQEDIESQIENAVMNLGSLSAPDGYSLDQNLESIDIQIIPEVLFLSSANPRQAECSYTYQGSVLYNLTLIHEEQTYPVDTNGEILFKPIRLYFPLEVFHSTGTSDFLEDWDNI